MKHSTSWLQKLQRWLILSGAMQVETINGVPTHVLSLKNHVQDSPPSPSNSSLLLVVPGSPGMGHFYIPFATKLFQLGQGSYDVAVVSHAGHSPGFTKPVPSCRDEEHQENSASIGSQTEAGFTDQTRDQTDWYGLEDQIAHKMAYIEKHAAGKESLYLVGHSIGCWMILQMLQLLDPSRVKKVLLLFPTIEKMSITPNGLKMASLFTTWRTPFTGLVWLLSSFPDWFRRYVLNWYFHSTPSGHLEHFTQGALNIDSKAIYNVLCMADQEMRTVIEPPLDVIDQNIDKIVFYYGVDDRWTLECCHDDMAKRYPDKDINLCSKGFPHAFVECASDEMAEFVFSKLPKKNKCIGSHLC